MKKIPILLLILLLAACSKDKVDPNGNNSPTYQHDPALIGGWLLDSIADSIITNVMPVPDGSALGSLPPTSDSISITSSEYLTYKWSTNQFVSCAIVSPILWNSNNSDSLRLFIGNYSTRWVSYSYSLSGTVLQLIIDNYQLNPPEHRIFWYWYHKSN